MLRVGWTQADQCVPPFHHVGMVGKKVIHPDDETDNETGDETYGDDNDGTNVNGDMNAIDNNCDFETEEQLKEILRESPNLKSMKWVTDALRNLKGFDKSLRISGKNNDLRDLLANILEIPCPKVCPSCPPNVSACTTCHLPPAYLHRVINPLPQKSAPAVAAENPRKKSNLGAPASKSESKGANKNTNLGKTNEKSNATVSEVRHICRWGYWG